MGPLAQVIGDVFGDASALMLSVLVFLAATVLALGLMRRSIFITSRLCSIGR